jgi:hypothetical protein
MFRTSSFGKKFGKSKKVEVQSVEESSKVDEDWLPEHLKSKVKATKNE